jgi:hypothetical protein
MSKLTEVLKNNKGQDSCTEWERIIILPMSVQDAAKKAGLTVEEAIAEAMQTPEIEYFPRVFHPGGVFWYRESPPRKLTREERKISKSDQP